MGKLRPETLLEVILLMTDRTACVTLWRGVPYVLVWTLPLPSLSHLAALSLCHGANDPELPDLLPSGEMLGLRLAG